VEGDLPDELRSIAELYAGCVSGAIQKEEYLDHIKRAGFSTVDIPKQKDIHIPQEILDEVLQVLPEEKRNLNNARLMSVTVRAVKL
jgi:arsenite methyltransferase